jgi:hypothetical protein
VNLNNNNHRINSSIIKAINFKAMIIGILLIATLVVSNTNGTAFAQDINNVLGCATTVKVTVIDLPGQTNISDTQVVLSNSGPNQDKGESNINIPGIGSGQLFVSHNLNENKFISLIINIQGQKGPSMSNDISGADVCASTSPKFVSLYIPGIPGTGSLSITKVN